MKSTAETCPMKRGEVVDRYFMEHRAKLIDIAAFLDRLDRAEPEGPPEDFRIEALREAIALLNDGQPHRARRCLERFSDPSTDMPEDAAGTKGATGAAPRKG